MNVFNFTHMGEVGQTKTNLAHTGKTWITVLSDFTWDIFGDFKTT